MPRSEKEKTEGELLSAAQPIHEEGGEKMASKSSAPHRRAGGGYSSNGQRWREAHERKMERERVREREGGGEGLYREGEREERKHSTLRSEPRHI